MRIKNIKNVIAKGKFWERLYYRAISNLVSEKVGFSRTVYSILNALLVPYSARQMVKKLKKIENTDELNIEYSELKKKYKDLPKETYSKTQWKIMCSFFISEGLFTMGYIARTKAKEYIQMDKKISFEKLLLAIEDGEVDKLDLLICDLEKQRLIPIETISLIKDLSNMLKDKPCAYNVDTEFETYIKGKDCHIVGPTVSFEDIEKTSFYSRNNLLIRNNVKIEQQITGLMTNVSYLNGMGVSRIINDLNEYIDKFDYIVIKHEEKRVSLSKIHKASNVSDLLYIGEANMLPIMLVDLRLNGCRKIYVSGNNLFLSKEAHSKDYMFSVDKKAQVIGFAIHDLISQHSFLRVLYLNNIFRPDSELEYVLKLSTYEYLDRMERIYCNC